MGAPQKPTFLYIGCADSRVPANEILGLGPGEVFVHRNIGNVVPATDLNALSVIEYAVTHLGVTDIIVTGHMDCGAVRAAMKKQDLGAIENWIRVIRDHYRLNAAELDAVKDDEERHRKFVAVNVAETCLSVAKTGPVQRKRFETEGAAGGAYPRIHGLTFDPKEGILNRVAHGHMPKMENLRHIYDLYATAK